MKPASIGSRVQVISNSNLHDYKMGSVHRVHMVDADGTFKAIDHQGVEGGFLHWEDCQAVGLGWDWIREHLDSKSLDLLSAFDGLQNLRLSEQVESKVILSTPNLAETILRLLPIVEDSIASFNADNADDNDDFESMSIDELLLAD